MKVVIGIVATIWCFAAPGQISIGLPSVESLFDGADVVCVCSLNRSNVTRQTGLTAGSYVHDIVVVQAYKGSGTGSLIEVRSQEAKDPLPYGDHYLLTLIRQPNSREMTIVTAFHLPGDFPLRGQSEEQRTLESDIDSYLTANPGHFLALIRLLERFDDLSPMTKNVLLRLTASSNSSSVVLGSTLVLLRKNVDPGRLFPLFLSNLVNTPPDQYPDLHDIDFIFIHNAERSDDNALESLANHHNLGLQHAALLALRKVADPSTTGFLIKELDTNDPDSQYLALITLAEIYHKGGDFGPGIGTFEQDKEKYIGLWKNWYRDQR
jgi:hypothetical protein